MLISCPECNANVSDSALACPQCGKPISCSEAAKPAKKSKLKAIAIWGGLLILGIIILASLGSRQSWPDLANATCNDHADEEVRNQCKLDFYAKNADKIKDDLARAGK